VTITIPTTLTMTIIITIIITIISVAFDPQCSCTFVATIMGLWHLNGHILTCKYFRNSDFQLDFVP